LWFDRRRSHPMKDRWESWVEQALRGRNLHEPPNAAMRRALALGSELASRVRRSHWLVELLFDSAVEPLPAGVRGSTADRRLLFEARSGADEAIAYQLDLRLKRERGGSLELTGQLLPPLVGARIEARAGRVRRSRTLGDTGEFVLRGLPRGAGSLQVRVEEADGPGLEFPEIPLLPADGESR